MPPNTVRRILEAVLLSVVPILICLALFRLAPFRNMELSSYDLRLRLEARLRPAPPSKDIVIIGIDDESLAQYGAWPWPRQYMAQIVDSLSQMGARAVFLDVAFPDPERRVGDSVLGGRTLAEDLKVQFDGLPDSVLEGVKSSSPVTGVVDNLERYRAGVTTAVTAVQSLLSVHFVAPDRAFGDSLALARNAGLITGAVATVSGIRSGEPPAVQTQALLRRQAQIWAVLHPTESVDALPEPLLSAMKDELGQVRTYRELYAALETSPDIDNNPALSPEAKKYAVDHLREVRRQVLDGLVQKAVSRMGATTEEVTPERILNSPLVARYAGTPELVLSAASRVLGQKYLHLTQESAGLGKIPDRPIGEYLVPPIVPVSANLEVLGADNEQKDPDGTVRSFPLFFSVPEGALPSAGLALLARVIGGKEGVSSLRVEDGPMVALPVRIGAAKKQPTLGRWIRIPVNSSGQALIHFTGDYVGSFTKLSMVPLVAYSKRRRDRECFIQDQQRKSGTEYEHALFFRDFCRRLSLADPDEYVTLLDLEARARGEPLPFPLAVERVFVQTRAVKAANLKKTEIHDMSPYPVDTPVNAKEKRTIDQWYQYFNGFLRFWEARKFDDIHRLKDLIDRIPDEAKRKSKEEKMAAAFEGLRIYGGSLDTLESELRKSVAGRICFIGHIANGSTDLATTPFGADQPNVLAHAALMNTIVTEHFIERPMILSCSLQGLVDPQTMQFPLLVLIGVVGTLIMWFTSSMVSVIVALGLVVGWIVVATIAFVDYGLWLDVVAPVLVTGVSAVLVLARRSRRSDQIRELFSTYLDPAVVAALAEDTGLSRQLGGQERHITSFISNITDFSGHCELLNPEQVSNFLTDYLTPMTEIVLTHGGVRDKFIGDQVLAFFGAPVKQDDHPARAVTAAVEQVERLVLLKEEWHKNEVRWYERLRAAGRELEVRIGLHTGNAKVGNFGSTLSKNYTVLGEPVNLALQLENANKQYGTRIIASDETLKGLEAKVVSRPLDIIASPGRATFVAHEVIGFTEGLAPYWPQLLAHYIQAIELYRRREFARAKVLFEQALALRPGDGPCLIYIERCTAFLRMPPPETWNGSVTLTLR